MGRKQHQSDRMYITNKEWQEANQSTNQSTSQSNSQIPFGHCKLSLVPWKTPVCDESGHVFDMSSIIDYVSQYRKHPLTGENLPINQLTRLNVTPVTINQSINQSSDPLYMDPISKKVFTAVSHIVANRLTGHVYEYSTIDRLNIQANQWEDLVDGSKFTKNDLITLQNPKQPVKRIVKPVKPSISQSTQPSIPDPLLARPLNQSGNQSTNISSSSSICSAVTPVLITQSTNQSNNQSIQSLNQLFELARSKGSIKGFVRLHLSIQPKNQSINQSANQSISQSSNQSTSHTINLEIDCSSTPKLAYYFLTLCENGSINQSICRKIVPGFFAQFGDQSIGQSINQSTNQANNGDDDELDESINHTARGIISCPNTVYQSINQYINQSVSQSINQSSIIPPMFILTLGPATDIDDTFTAFGKLVGGKQTLDLIEKSINQSIDQSSNQSTNQSINQIIIQSVTVYTNPFKQSLPDILNQSINEAKKLKQQKDAIDNERRAWFSNPAPISQSINQSTNQSVTQSTHQSINQSVKGPINVDMSKFLPVSKKRSAPQSTISQSINQSINQSIDPSNQSLDDESGKKQRVEDR